MTTMFENNCVNTCLILHLMLQIISLLQTTIAFDGEMYVP